jgi:AcrR family transcriptional regulator
MIPVRDSTASSRATYHHGDLRRTLLDTALRLVNESGPEGFSLREAARAVGVSPAAAYRHFADKPALLTALAAEGHGRLAEAMEKASTRLAAVDPPPARAVATLVAIGRAYVEFAVKNPSFFRVMFGPAVKDPEFDPCCATSGRDAYAILSDTLDQLLASGAIPPERRTGGEIGAWSAVHGFATLVVDGALPISARQRADAYRMLARSMLFSLGCDASLLPAAPRLWDGAHPHPEPARRRRGAGR